MVNMTKLKWIPLHDNAMLPSPSLSGICNLYAYTDFSIRPLELCYSIPVGLVLHPDSHRDVESIQLGISYDLVCLDLRLAFQNLAISPEQNLSLLVDSLDNSLVTEISKGTVIASIVFYGHDGRKLKDLTHELVKPKTVVELRQSVLLSIQEQRNMTEGEAARLCALIYDLFADGQALTDLSKVHDLPLKLCEDCVRYHRALFG